MNETNVTREMSDNGDDEKQLECFGLGRIIMLMLIFYDLQNS